eukprot:5353989-Prorocentrum_lima.AAC.1
MSDYSHPIHRCIVLAVVPSEVALRVGSGNDRRLRGDTVWNGLNKYASPPLPSAGTGGMGRKGRRRGGGEGRHDGG